MKYVAATVTRYKDVVTAALTDAGTLTVKGIWSTPLEVQGGKFKGGEEDRIEAYRKALALGAALVDAEWGTEACRRLAGEGAPLLISHHDFEGMPSREDLDRLASEMALADLTEARKELL